MIFYRREIMAIEGLNLDNILDEEDINLFGEDNSSDDTTTEEDTSQEETKKEKEDTTEADPDTLFEGEPESVGSEEKNNEEKEDTLPKEGTGTSPNNDFFSSIAEAFAEEGILPNLDEKTIKDIHTPEDFRKAIDDYIKSELNEQQQRVKEALDNDVEPNAIRQYEGVINYLNSLSEEDLKAETEQGEELRKRLLYQDYINRGFDKNRAEKEVNRAITNGTDIEDALEALNGCKSFYQDSYKSLLQEAKKAKEEEQEDQRKRAESLKNTMLDKKNKFFGDLDIDQATRQKAFDSISKPVYKDNKTGEVYTAIQKYELDNREEFLAKLGLIFTLTDGFKTLDGLVKNKVKKEVKRGFKDLENRINNSSRDSSGNLRFTSGADDNESYLGKGIRLAL